MRILITTTLLLTVISTLSINSISAYCSRCVKIEEERAKEQLTHPQSLRYYENQENLNNKEDLPIEKKSKLINPVSTDEKTWLKDSTIRSSLSEDKTIKMSDPSPYSSKNSHSLLSTNAFNSYTKNSWQSSTYAMADYHPDTQKIKEDYFEEDHLLNFNDDKLDPSKLSQDETETTLSSYRPNPYALSIPSKAYSTIYTILKVKNFLETLDGTFTLLIPTNDAIRQLPMGTLEEFIRPENEEKLAALISNHIIAKKILKKDFKENHNLEVKAISGRNLTLASKDGKLFIDNVQILRVEPAGYDGVIYVIDKVLFP